MVKKKLKVDERYMLFIRLALILMCCPYLILAEENFRMTPEEALEKLQQGNKRYTNDALLHPNRSQLRREAIASRQNPFAVIMGCSDSRVSPEVVFDQGLGDLFIVRTAGNVVGPIEMESIKFGSVVLGASIIMVLGHENCGAIEAVVADRDSIIPVIVDKIKPGIKQYVGKPEALSAAVKANIRSVVNQVRNEKAIADLIERKKVNVVGGYYNLASGEVEIIQ